MENGKIERIWNMMFNARQIGIPVMEQLPFLVQLYNDRWPHRSVNLHQKKTFEIDPNPQIIHQEFHKIIE